MQIKFQWLALTKYKENLLDFDARDLMQPYQENSHLFFSCPEQFSGQCEILAVQKKFDGFYPLAGFDLIDVTEKLHLLFVQDKWKSLVCPQSDSEKIYNDPSK